MKRLRAALALLAAALVMAIAGTAVQTQFVIASLQAVGAPVALRDRLAMTMADLAGFAPLYGALSAIGLAVAFAAAGLVRRFLKLPRGAVFAAAGAVAVAVMLAAMREVFFGMQLVAGARSGAGLAAQILCGALAGAAFAALTRRTKAG